MTGYEIPTATANRATTEEGVAEWFAVQSKPHQEKLASAHVARLDLEVLLPRWTKSRPVGGVFRDVIGPLFPGYFFARFSPDLSLDLVRTRPGVVRVLGGRLGPIPVATELVEELRDRFGEGARAVFREPALLPGTLVTIENGPFRNFVGRVEREEKESARVALFLEAMGQARVLVERRHVTVTAGAE